MTVTLILRIALGVMFAVAAVAKFADRDAWRRTLVELNLPPRLISTLALAVPLAELGIAAALIGDPTATWGALAAIVMLALLSIGIAHALLRGLRPDCNCFGRLGSSPLGWGLVARNIALAGLAGLVVWNPDFGWPSLDPTVVAVVLGACLLLGLQAWFCYALLRQNGRILVRLATVEASAQAPIARPGLAAGAVGAPAPYFALPGLDADSTSLTSLTESGRALLLTFIDAGCGPCTALLPRLAEWQRRGRETLTVAVVSPGDAGDDASWAREHDLDSVILQPANLPLSELYGVRATPSALLIDADGRIASPVTEGADAIVELAESALGSAETESLGEPRDARAPALVASALAGGAALLAVSGATAPVAAAASPERAQIRALIDAAEPRLAATDNALNKAMKRYSSSLKPTASSRSTVARAINDQAAELGALYQAVAASTVTSDLDREAQRLVLEAIQLTALYLTKLNKAIRAKSGGAAARYLKSSHAALDDSLQRGINAQAALSQ